MLRAVCCDRGVTCHIMTDEEEKNIGKGKRDNGLPVGLKDGCGLAMKDQIMTALD